MEPSTRRYVPLLIAGAALIAAACSDSVAPTPTVDQTAATLTAYTGASTAIRGTHRTEDEAATFSFVISPRGGIVRVGGFYLNYPASAVCDPQSSGYGPEYWRQSCRTLRSSITISARVWADDGRTHADFFPDIRFDPSKNVTISARIMDIVGQPVSNDWTSKFAIWYSTRVGDDRFLIDETLLFPELATVFQEQNGVATGWATRRIYHFSGYYVRSGRVCDDSSESCDAGSESSNLLQ